MARVHQISEKQELPAESQHVFDGIAGSRGQVRGPFSVLLHSPEIAGRAAHLGAYIRFEGVLSDRERELAIITAAREFDCGYEWAAHAKLAKDYGISEATIDLVANRGPLSGLPDDEALIVGYGREILRDHKVSQATYDAASERFGDKGVTELTATLGYYVMLACVLNAFEVTPNPDDPRLP